MNERANGEVTLTVVSPLQKVEDPGEVRVSETDDGVGRAVVDRDAIGVVIDERSAGEDDVRDVTNLLVERLGREEIVASASKHLPRLVEVEERRTHRVDEAVTRSEDAVVEHEPAVFRLDRDRPRSDLGRLPGQRDRRHDVAMPSPVDEVGALRVVDLP